MKESVGSGFHEIDYREPQMFFEDHIVYRGGDINTIVNHSNEQQNGNTFSTLTLSVGINICGLASNES